MSEPLVGQKTNIVAGAFAVMQALSMAGVLDPSLVESLSQATAALFAFTLALKGLRAAKKV